MTAFMVPPSTTAGIPLAVGEAEGDVELPPQAASNCPMTVAERPKTEARMSSWRRVILPFTTCSTRCCPYSLAYCSSAISLLPLGERLRNDTNRDGAGRSLTVPTHCGHDTQAPSN